MLDKLKAHVLGQDGMPGFLTGFLHGSFILIILFLNFFYAEITLYKSPNMGFSYNLGFVLGLAFLCSSS